MSSSLVRRRAGPPRLQCALAAAGQGRGHAAVQPLPARGEGLGEHAGVGHGRHEVGVALPSGHGVQVQVPGNARPGRLAQVGPEVEPRDGRPPPGGDAEPGGRPQLGSLPVGQVAQRAHVAQRDGHQVAAGVRVGVEHHQGGHVPPTDTAGDGGPLPTIRQNTQWPGRRSDGRCAVDPGSGNCAGTRTVAPPRPQALEAHGGPHLAGPSAASGSVRSATSSSSGGRELGHRNAAAGRSLPRRFTPDRAGGHVVVPHHQDVGDLQELRPADPGAERLGRPDRPRPGRRGPRSRSATSSA